MSGWGLVAPLKNIHFAPAAATVLPLGPPNAEGVREPFPALERTYSIGGSGVQNDMEAYDPSSNSWTSAAQMPTARLEMAAAVAFGPAVDFDGGSTTAFNIYVVGGSDGTNPLNTLEAFTPLVGFHFRPAGVWTSPLAPMPVARTRLAVVAGPDGRIYALGGFDGSNSLTIVEAYNPNTNSWTTVAPMTTPRDGLAAATGPDGRIYAIGGFDTDYLSSVEAYDVATNSWTHVASMVHPRYTFAAVTGPDKQIYAIGGEFRFASVNTVEVYNTATNSWSSAAPMTTPRRQLAAAVGKDGRIYAIGGIDNLTGPLATVEAFSP